MSTVTTQTQVAALTDILIYLAQSDDLTNERMPKDALPEDAKGALKEWSSAINAETGEDTASFENTIAEDVIHCRYYDDTRNFYIMKYEYFFMDKTEGWLIVQQNSVIGDSSVTT